MNVELVVVGALNRDLIFSVDHVPGQGETVLGAQSVADGGKGANQAVQASHLGVATALVGRVGDDPAGGHLMDGLADAGVDTRFVGRLPGEQSGTACVWASPGGDKRIVVVPGANRALGVADLEAASEAIMAATVVLVQMEIPSETVKRAVALGSAGAATVVLNAAPATAEALDLLPDVDVLIVNRAECAMLTATSVETPDDAYGGAQKLQALGSPVVIVTLGAEGAIVAAAGRADIKPVAVSAIDSSGAGDAFCGTVAAGLAEGLDVISSAGAGALAGALCAGRPGARSSIKDAPRIRRKLSSARSRRT